MEGYHNPFGASVQYIEEMLRIHMINMGDIISAPEDFQYFAGYHKYIGGCSVSWRDIIIHIGYIMGFLGGCLVVHRDSCKCTEHPRIYSQYPRT